MERDNQIIDNCISQAEFVRKIIVEQFNNILVVHTVFRSSKTQQELWLKIVYDPAVGVRYGMVTLIDYDIIKRLFVEKLQRAAHRHVG